MEGRLASRERLAPGQDGFPIESVRERLVATEAPVSGFLPSVASSR
jgi:hypothetical protein